MKKVIILVIIGMLIILSLLFIIVFIGDNFSSVTSRTIGDEDSLEEGESIILLSSQCNTNVYDCYHFASQSDAQKVFEECGNDVHYLDGDGDGIACEILLKYD